MMCSRTCATFALMNSASSCTSRICRAGKFGPTLREQRAHAFGDRRGVGAALLLDRERHGIGAVQAGRRTSAPRSRPRRGRRHGRERSIPLSDRRMTFSISDDGLKLAFRPQRNRLTLAGHAAAGHVEVLGAERVGDDADRQAERLEAAADRGPPGSRARSPPLTSTAATPSICSMSGLRSSSIWRRVTSDALRRARRRTS